MHLNKCTLIGRVGERGCRLTYDERSTPTCSFTLEVCEPGRDKVFTTYLPIEITSKFAEELSVSLEPGDEVLIDGRLKYKSVTDSKTAQKNSKLVITSWTATKAVPASVTSAD